LLGAGRRFCGSVSRDCRETKTGEDGKKVTKMTRGHTGILRAGGRGSLRMGEGPRERNVGASEGTSGGGGGRGGGGTIQVAGVPKRGWLKRGPGEPEVIPGDSLFFLGEKEGVGGPVKTRPVRVSVCRNPLHFGKGEGNRIVFSRLWWAVALCAFKRQGGGGPPAPFTCLWPVHVKGEFLLHGSQPPGVQFFFVRGTQARKPQGTSVKRALWAVVKTRVVYKI